jgi:hypothetical protein
VSKGVVNDPRNKSLRFDLLEFGVKELCRELTTRGAPLRMRDDQPVMGRFFADSCSAQPIDEETRKSIVVQYSGRGYAWVRDTGRVGFTSSGVVEFAPDFQIDGGRMYVYFRTRNVNASAFQLLLVESGMAATALTTLGVPVNSIGQHIVESQLKRGFTVVRHGKSGEVDFGLGLIPKGELPFHPFQVKGSDKLTLANDRTELHAGQQDFIGAFEIEKDGENLWLTLALDGAPAADVAIVPKAAGDQMIAQLTSSPGPQRPSMTPFIDEGFVSSSLYRRPVSLPKGFYYLVLDHSGVMGPTAPDANTGGARAAKVDYLVQRGGR